MTQSLMKFNHPDLIEILNEIEFDNEAIEKMHEQPVAKILSSLIDGQNYLAAIKLLAFGLPVREAIWWGYLCVSDVDSYIKNAEVHAVLNAVSSWVRAPSDELRLNVSRFDNQYTSCTVEGWLALAVQWTGDSIVPSENIPVEAGKYMSGHAVANAIIVVSQHVELADDFYKQSLKRGLHIALGGNGVKINS